VVAQSPTAPNSRSSHTRAVDDSFGRAVQPRSRSPATRPHSTQCRSGAAGPAAEAQPSSATSRATPRPHGRALSDREGRYNRMVERSPLAIRRLRFRARNRRQGVTREKRAAGHGLGHTQNTPQRRSELAGRPKQASSAAVPAGRPLSLGAPSREVLVKTDRPRRQVLLGTFAKRDCSADALATPASRASEGPGRSQATAGARTPRQEHTSRNRRAPSQVSAPSHPLR
jgi:hypothetical protein